MNQLVMCAIISVLLFSHEFIKIKHLPDIWPLNPPCEPVGSGV